MMSDEECLGIEDEVVVDVTDIQGKAHAFSLTGSQAYCLGRWLMGEVRMLMFERTARQERLRADIASMFSEER